MKTIQMEKLQAMSALDRSIYMHFKLVSGDLGIIFVIVCAMLLMVVSYILMLVLPLLLIPLYYFTYKVYRRLFYDTLYGKDAYLFQSLPVSAEDAVRAKIFVCGIGSAIVTVAFFLVTVCTTAIVGTEITPMTIAEILLQELLNAGAVPEQLSYIATLEFVRGIVALFVQGALVLAAVTAYHGLLGGAQGAKLRGQGRRRLLMSALVLLAVGINAVVSQGMTWVARQLGLGYGVWCALLNLALLVVVLLVSYRFAVRMLKEKYFL